MTTYHVWSTHFLGVMSCYDHSSVSIFHHLTQVVPNTAQENFGLLRLISAWSWSKQINENGMGRSRDIHMGALYTRYDVTRTVANNLRISEEGIQANCLLEPVKRFVFINKSHKQVQTVLERNLYCSFLTYWFVQNEQFWVMYKCCGERSPSLLSSTIYNISYPQ